MEIVTSKKLPASLIWYFTDESVLYTMLSHNSLIEINIFDPESFKSISTFVTHYKPNFFAKPIVDENCVYLPSADGRLIGVDKFSGKMLIDVDLGMMTCVSEPKQTSEYIFSICGIPLTNGTTTQTKSFVICKNSKLDGKKIGQSKLFSGRFSPLFIGAEAIWVVFDKILHKLSFDLENLLSVPINGHCPYGVQQIQDQIIAATNLGHLETFDCLSGKNTNRFITTRNRVPPVIYKDRLVWLVENKVVDIHLGSKSIRESQKFDSVNSGCVSFEEHIYATDDLGRLTDFDIEKGSQRKLGVSQNKIKYPVLIDKQLFVASQSEIYQICTHAK